MVKYSLVVAELRERRSTASEKHALRACADAKDRIDLAETRILRAIRAAETSYRRFQHAECAAPKRLLMDLLR